MSLAVMAGNTGELDVLRRAGLELLTHPEACRDTEELSNLLAATITWMGDSSRHWRPKDLSVRESYRRIAELTEEYIQEN